MKEKIQNVIKKNARPVQHVIIIGDSLKLKMIEKHVKETLVNDQHISIGNIHFMTAVDIGKGASQRAKEIHQFGKNEFIPEDKIRFDIEYCIEYENN